MIRDVPLLLAEINAIRVECRAQCAARIARCGRNKDAFESRLGKDSGVRHTVECNAATKTKVGQTGLSMKRASDVHQRLLEYCLHAGSAISVSPALGRVEVDRLIGIAR